MDYFLAFRQGRKLKNSINNPHQPYNNNNSAVRKTNNRQRDYEGYSHKRKDQVELILSTLNSQLKSTQKNNQIGGGTLVLPQITKHAGAI